MARSKSSAPAVQLFPFLAVLLCAMGALILLLMVMTKKLRERTVAEFVAQEAALLAETHPPTAPVPVPIEQPVALPAPPAGPTRAEREAAMAAKVAAHAAAQLAAAERQRNREAEWQRLVAELEADQSQKRGNVTRLEQQLADLKRGQTAATTSLQNLQRRQEKISELTTAEEQHRALLERQQQDIATQITQANARLAQLKRELQDADSRFTMIPYDGVSGTTRRPIYLECTAEGVRFWPENVLLDENDLKGFTETYNPLLKGVQTLSAYWIKQGIQDGEIDDSQKPYVLLLVRPQGTVTYYLARKMLSEFSQPFGYELVEDALPLQFPPVDPVAKRQLELVVAQALRFREQAAGVALRNTSTIEFDSLDEEAMVIDNRQKSPFRNPETSGGGRDITISRSPIDNADVLPARRPGATGSGSSSPRTWGSVPKSLAGNGRLPGAGGGSASVKRSSQDPEAPLLLPGDKLTATPQEGTSGAKPSAGGDYRPLAVTPSDVFNEPLPDPTVPAGTRRAATTDIASGSRRGADSGTSDAASRTVADATGSAEKTSTPFAETAESRYLRENQAEKNAGRQGAYSNSSGAASTLPATTPQSGASQSALTGAGAALKPKTVRPPLPSGEGLTSQRKRDLAKARWGGNTQSAIGFERTIKIVAESDRLTIGEERTVILLTPDANRAEVVEQVLGAIDTEAVAWGRPPTRFYWVPYLAFDVRPGGELHHERLQGPLREWGIFTETKHAQPVAEQVKPAASGKVRR